MNPLEFQCPIVWILGEYQFIKQTGSKNIDLEECVDYAICILKISRDIPKKYVNQCPILLLIDSWTVSSLLENLDKCMKETIKLWKQLNQVPLRIHDEWHQYTVHVMK